MRFLKSFLLQERNFTNDGDFRKVFDYFVDEVFTKDKRRKIEQSVIDAFDSLMFLDINYSSWGGKKLRPSYGVCRKTTSFCNMSMDFAKILNDETYDFDAVKTWSHLFHSVYNELLYKTSFGETSHGNPYYQFSLKVTVSDKYGNYSIEDIKRELSYGGYKINIGHIISKEIDKTCELHSMGVEAKTQIYPSHSDLKNGIFDIQITVIDIEFEPKDILK